MAEPVRLKNIDEFRKLLADYHVSAPAKKLLETINYVPVSGLAGGGRNTVINYLTTHFEYHFVISDTTRPPKLRNGVMEVDGVDYFFRTEEDMLNDIRNGAFLEAEIIHNQQVSGTSIRELLRAKDTGKIPIRDIEYGGIENVYKAKPNATIIGLLPPNYGEWIRRFSNREEIHEEEFRNRLQTAEKVLDAMLAKPYFKLVINNTVEQCAADIREIVERGYADPAKQENGKKTARAILAGVQEVLRQ